MQEISYGSYGVITAYDYKGTHGISFYGPFATLEDAKQSYIDMKDCELGITGGQVLPSDVVIDETTFDEPIDNRIRLFRIRCENTRYVSMVELVRLYR